MHFCLSDFVITWWKRSKTLKKKKEKNPIFERYIYWKRNLSNQANSSQTEVTYWYDKNISHSEPVLHGHFLRVDSSKSTERRKYLSVIQLYYCHWEMYFLLQVVLSSSYVQVLVLLPACIVSLILYLRLWT